MFDSVADVGGYRQMEGGIVRPASESSVWRATMRADGELASGVASTFN